MNVAKIDFALKNGTEDQKREVLDGINKINLISEAVWYETQVKQIPVLKPNTVNDPVRQTLPKPEIALFEFFRTKKSTKNYYDENGYTYTQRNKRVGVTYFRCRNSIGDGCKASVICRDNNLNKSLLSIPHTHVPREKDVDNLKFLNKLDEIVLENPFKKPMEIYSEAKKKLRGMINMSHIGELIDYNVFIHRKRKADIPLLPKTIEQFEELINDSRYRAKYHYDNTEKLFYHGIWKGPTGNNVVFMSQKVLKAIRKKKSIKLIMDGTFKSLPIHLKFRQLYIISVIIEDRCYPLMYVLMEKKDTSSYKLLFNKIKEMIPNVRVKNCMADYEAATRKAIREVFPKSRLSGCYFHYVQAIVKKFSKFGLNEEKFSRERAQICALALLPNEKIIEGFEIICKRLKSPQFNRFKEYWLRYWSVANISVYGLKDRTNNFAESLNHTLNVILKSRHPDIWTLIENLKTIESNKSDELRKVNKGHIPRKKSGNTKMKISNKKIKTATKYFNKTGRVKQFLKKVTFLENFESFYQIRIGNGNDEDGDDDEFIANNFNAKCNFRSHKLTKKALDSNSSSGLAAEGTSGTKLKRTIKKTKITNRKTSTKHKKINKNEKKQKELKSTRKMGSKQIATEVCVTNTRNLMGWSINEILKTFSDHDEKLKQIYEEKSKLKKHYKAVDLPDLIELDIVNVDQLRAMANLAEMKLVKEEQYNSTDVIFDVILPEWALAALCKHLNVTRVDAVQMIKNQNLAFIHEIN